MKLAFADARIWRYLVSSIAKVIEEGIFNIIPDEGLRFRAMDPSHVIMLDMFFPVDSFEEFEVEEEKKLGINFEDLAKIMRRATKNDRLELMEEENRLSIVFSSSRSYRKFTIPLLDITGEELPEAQLEFNANIKMLADAYRELIKDVELIGDVIKLHADKEVFKAVTSSDLGEAEIIITPESGEIIEANVKDPPQVAAYTLEYFSDLLSAAQVADSVIIRFSSDMPVQVEYELPQNASFKFLVAPRVE
ncbi:MAG: proliferating cell nuclear antigen (pcna) [Pyrodictiaceae archaeon]